MIINCLTELAPTQEDEEIVAIYGNFVYLCCMNRRIKTYGGYFQAFARTLDKEVLRKIDYLLQLLKSEERLSSRFVKLIRDGLFELRISAKGNIYRLFFIFDEGDIVILLNGFQNKTQKTPRKEIDKALKIKEMYYADKQSQDRGL